MDRARGSLEWGKCRDPGGTKCVGKPQRRRLWLGCKRKDWEVSRGQHVGPYGPQGTGRSRWSGSVQGSIRPVFWGLTLPSAAHPYAPQGWGDTPPLGGRNWEVSVDLSRPGAQVVFLLLPLWSPALSGLWWALKSDFCSADPASVPQCRGLAGTQRAGRVVQQPRCLHCLRLSLLFSLTSLLLSGLTFLSLCLWAPGTVPSRAVAARAPVCGDGNEKGSLFQNSL